MKLVFSLLALLAANSAFALPPGPMEDKCNKGDNAVKLQRAVIADLRSLAKKDGHGAYTFKFTHVWRFNKDEIPLVVYYERTGDNETERQGYVAQYTVDEATCAPTLQKNQVLVGGTSASSKRLGGMGDKEKCNYGDGQDSIIADLVRSANWLNEQNAPGSTTANFSFTGVERKAGTFEAIAIYESARPGMYSTPLLAALTVDESCKATMKISTSFARTVTDY